jgi:hypothetical protein
MYLMIGLICFGVAFLMLLNRKGVPASIALFLLGAGLAYAQLTSQP